MGKFPITSAANDFFHTPEEIDDALARFAEDQFSDEDDDLLIEYAIHLLYKDGKTETTPEEISEKIQLLVVDHVIYGLEQKGLVECGIDSDGEIVTNLTKEGELVYEALVQEG